MQIAVVLYPGMTALDAIGPYEVLKAMPGAEVRFVGNEVGPVAVDSGVLFLGATHTFAEIPSPDIVLVPGGETGTAAAMANTELIEWLVKVHETTQWTTSVCSGALILAAAGILDGLPATTHWSVQSLLGPLGARPQRDKRIVHTGKVVTAAGVSAGIDMGLWLIGEICGRERAEMIQLSIEYDPQPPFDAGHPSKVPARLREKTRRESLKRSANPREALAVPKVIWRQTLRTFRATRGAR